MSPPLFIIPLKVFSLKMTGICVIKLCNELVSLTLYRGSVMEKFRTFLYGMGTAVFAWLALIVTDAVDEYMLNESCLLGSGVFFGLPIVMLIVYIKHNLRVRPGAGRLARWFAGYYIAFLPIWYFVYLSVNNNRFFIEQHKRASFLDLNGIEYIMYGYSTLAAFSALCLLFHVIWLIVRAGAKGDE